MVTGENRLFAFDSDNPAAHVAVTVEMLSPEHRTELCVIDEIQMLRDPLRGGAWTKALLGAAADEVHLCGEESAYDIICRLLDPIGEHVDFRRYERKGELIVIGTHGLRDLSSVQDGDCVIHFSKKSIIEMARQLKSQQKRECAIVFGDLPPEVKQEQVKRFNDPSDPCKILLATDAIGMGMNLNIKRVIFTTLKSRENTLLPAYFVKQIAGRAGRYASVYCTGEVMTLADGDAKVLEKLMREPIEPIDQAGIAPSFDQIEMFSFHLPQYSLVQLLDIFTSICTVNDDYFLCLDDSIRQIALLIGHIQLSIRERYMFCFTPIASGPHPFLNSSFVKMVRRYAEGNAITIAWVRQLVAPELKVVNQIEAINGLVDVYEFMGAYLWLSYRFEEHFCDRSSVRELQKECGRIIQESIQKMLSENEKKVKEMPTLTLRHRQEEPAVLEESELRLLKKSLPGKRVVVHKEQQLQEIEALESMYTNELRVLCRGFPGICVELDVRPDVAEFVELFGEDVVTLRATLPLDYPNSHPSIDLPSFDEGDDDSSQPKSQFWNQCAQRVRNELDKAIEESLGMPMLFTLLGTLQEFFVQMSEDYLKNRDEKERIKADQVEREERAKFEGTRVTAESFKKWNNKFLETVKTNRPQELVKDNQTTKRMTGKQLFLSDKSLNISDLQFLEGTKDESPVEIDQSLFEDDLDFDAEDDEEYIPEAESDE
uniref:RNA helicase n=1 Tax=Globodera pallida TaxID=36090 RepID=A0A183BZG9_GLOPA